MLNLSPCAAAEAENQLDLFLDLEFSNLTVFLADNSSDLDPFVRLCVLRRLLEVRRIKESLSSSVSAFG